MFRTHTYFNQPDDSGAAVETPPAEVVAETTPAEVVETTPVEEVAPVEEAAPVDWSARVTEWGGEETVAEALALRQAFSTREGVEELFRQAAQVLGHDISVLTAAGNEPAAEAEPTLDELLADPERVVTVADIQRILAGQAEQQSRQTEQQRQAQAVISAIDTTFEDLKIVDEDDRRSVLAIADSLVPDAAKGDPAQVRAAITKAHEHFQSKVRAAAEAIVAGRAAAHEALPTPLPAGGSGGSEPVVGEPMTLAEAKERARKQLGIS